ncbi:MAG: LytR C-terminal domain-containing protein [Candidatus Shapirobacteria bacterium]
MSLFSRPQLVVWPKSAGLDLYLISSSVATLTSFDLNLYQPLEEADLSPLKVYLSQNRLKSAKLIIPDDVILTRTFVYDSEIDTIDNKELIVLAKGYVDFPLESDSISAVLEKKTGKTLIKTTILCQEKLKNLYANLSQLGLKVITTASVSQSIANVFSKYYKPNYFAVYPQTHQESVLVLAQGSEVYLSSIVKNQKNDIQKIVNYSQLYFGSPVEKVFLPVDFKEKSEIFPKIESTEYNPSQIALQLSLPANLPLPVIGALSSAIISLPNSNLPIQKPMEPKKNYLPIVAVFIVTAALASIIIWYVVSRNNVLNGEPPLEPGNQVTPTTAVAPPTATPIPSIAEISKTLKLQVLNGTDINGQASVLKQKLVALGFTDVTTGNSKTKATENLVNTKPELASSSAYFQSKLADFPATFSATLPATGTYDIVFTIGTDLKTGASTATASPTVTP